MSEYYYHAVSSASRFGGTPEDYLAIHKWLDRGKAHMPDFRHRALTHHSQGIENAIQIFGDVIKISTGAYIPVKAICEKHIKEDLGKVPTLSDWFRQIKPERWMSPPAKLTMSEKNKHHN